MKLKDKKFASEVIAVTIGPQACQEVLRTALSMGADKAVHVVTDNILDKSSESMEFKSIDIAKAFKKIAEKESAHVIIYGCDDRANNSTGSLTASLLGWSQCTFVSKIDPLDGKVRILVGRRSSC
jgi:electron transfer flavoprotein beta subunit